MHKRNYFFYILLLLFILVSCNSNIEGDPEYRISFDANGGSAVPAQIVVYNSCASEPSFPSRYGYTFLGWYEGDSRFDFNTRITENKSLVAHWSTLSCLISFDPNGGTLPGENSINYAYGSTCGTLPVPTRNGYTFAGWYRQGSEGETLFTNASIVDTVSPLTCIARWSVNTYSLSFDSAGGTNFSDRSVVYDESWGTLPIPQKDSFSFEGWYIGDTYETQVKVEDNAVWSYSSDVVLHARWKGVPVTVSFDPTPGTVDLASKIGYYSANYGSLPTPERSGYSFAGWYLTTDHAGNQITSLSIVESPTQEQTLYAKWVKEIYTITFNSNGGTDVSPASVAYQESLQSMPAPTKAHYTLSGWYTSPTFEENTKVSLDTKIEDSCTLYAKWDKENYTVTFDSNGGTDVSPAGVAYQESLQSMPAPTKAHYTLSGWYTSPTFDENTKVSLDTKIEDSCTLYAKWDKENYTVTFNSNGGTDVSPASVAYQESLQSMPAPTKAHYTLSGWYASPTFEENTKITLETEFAGSCTVYAKWQYGTGPAGGYVFYDKGSYSDGWRYLEAAPEDLTRYVWGPDGQLGTATDIGTGKSNTEKIGPYRDGSMSAAGACMAYSLNGYDGWFLPSMDELNLMYENIKMRGIGNFSLAGYLSSTEHASVDDGYAWGRNFGTGHKYGYLRNSDFYKVRPVRAF